MNKIKIFIKWVWFTMSKKYRRKVIYDYLVSIMEINNKNPYFLKRTSGEYHTKNLSFYQIIY